MDEKKKPSIIPAENGPYIVKGLENFANRKGAIEGKPTMALCRCGESANKPFCDGTHSKIGFSSSKLDGRVEDKQDDYKGEKITIHDNRGICAHAGACTDGLAAVFHLREEPWIYPDSSGTEEIMETIKKCPSGALSYTVENVEPTNENIPTAIFVAPNGPYVVTGKTDLESTERGEGASTERFTLCRCGGSKNKPFCDGTHWYNDFKDDKN